MTKTAAAVAEVPATGVQSKEPRLSYDWTKTQEKDEDTGKDVFVWTATIMDQTAGKAGCVITAKIEERNVKKNTKRWCWEVITKFSDEEITFGEMKGFEIHERTSMEVAEKAIEHILSLAKFRVHTSRK